MIETVASSLPPATVSSGQVFRLRPGQTSEPFLTIDDWSMPVQYFIGRNGSGKSKTARALRGVTAGRLLATDRLVGLMSFVTYQWGSVATDFKGVPLSDTDRQQSAQMTAESGSATDDLYALHEQPEVWLRVAAFIRRSLGRVIELRESAGFLDPFVRIGDTEYSLLRDEGHGLREIVVLLAAVYRSDTSLLIIDEPELHLHPSMARLWLSELIHVCSRTGKRAIVVTHEPSFIRPKSMDDLRAIWLFSAEEKPRRLSDAVAGGQSPRVEASLVQNPQLVSQIAFSPRPVLVEGTTDVAALSTALTRLESPEVVAQTDLVNCGGSGTVGLWLEVCVGLGLDVRAVADLDALFDAGVQRILDSLPGLTADLIAEFAEAPGTLRTVIRPLTDRAKKEGVNANPRDRADWLRMLTDKDSAEVIRRDRVLTVLRKHGLWLHLGTLEQVLGITVKSVEAARAAASAASNLDDAAVWASYELDLKGDVAVLLGVAVERVAHSIMEAQRSGIGTEFRSPVGGSAVADARLVRVDPLGDGRHRLTVIAPEEFAGQWLEFDRDTPSTSLNLQSPAA